MTTPPAQNSSAQAPREPDYPYPARFWWLKRLFLASILFLVLLALLRWYVGRKIDAQLQTRIAYYQALGQPVVLSDFQEPAVPDEQNAAFFLRRAAKGLVLTSAQQSFTVGPARQLSASELALISQMVQANRAALADARRARSCGGVNWDLKLVSPAITILLPDLNEQRQLANVLRAAALQAHQQGDDAAAIEYIRDIFAISRAIDRQPLFVSHLVAIGISALGIDTVQRITPDLAVAASAPAPGPALRQQIEALVADLLDDRDYRQGMVRAMCGERMMQLDTIQAIANGQLSMSAFFPNPNSPSPASPTRQIVGLVKPLVVKDAMNAMDYMSVCVEAAAQPDAPSSTAKSRGLALPRSSLKKGPFMLSQLLVPATGVMMSRHYQGLADRRSAAVALAVRLYEIDQGHLPAQLSGLVPRYLAAIPIDPRSGTPMTHPLVPATQKALSPSRMPR